MLHSRTRKKIQTGETNSSFRCRFMFQNLFSGGMPRGMESMFGGGMPRGMESMFGGGGGN